MSRAFAITMTRPHETLGLPQPFGRRLPQGIWAWNAAFLVGTLTMAIFYVVQVNSSTSKGYALRTVQNQVDTLKTQTQELQEKTISLSSLQALSTRASQLGFVQTDSVNYLDPASKAYAMAQ